jgi:hypothetical protein
MTKSFKFNLAPNAHFSQRDRIGAWRKLVKLTPPTTLWQMIVAVWNYDTRAV